jgi:F0F1-type ATP synthase membrane subunit b/b'
MTRRSLVAAVLAALLIPSAAIAAEGAPEPAGSWTALLFYVINFGLFVFILVKYALPMARDFFTSRAHSIRDSLSKAESNLREAEELATRARERTSKLESEKSQIGADLDAETAYQIQRIRELARETAARIMRDAELSAAAARGNGQRRMRVALAAAAARLARERLVAAFQPNDQERLLDGFVAKLREEAR